LLVDLGFRADIDAKIVTSPQPDGGLSLDVERIRHDQRQDIAVEMYRYDMKVSQEAKRKLRGLDGNRWIFSGKKFDTQLLAERLDDVAFGDVTKIDEDAPEFIGAFLLKRQRILQVLFGNDTTVQQ